MAWQIDVADECAVVRMNTNKVNVQNDQFFADLHGAFDRLEREFQDLPVGYMRTAHRGSPAADRTSGRHFLVM